MGGMSIWHWLIVGIVVLLAFGGIGKIPRLMGDLAKGVTAFKKGLKDTEDEVTKPVDGAPQVTTEGTVAATTTTEPKKEAKV